VKTFLSLCGIGLRAPHYTEFLTKKPKVAWVEVHSENYFGEGGHAIATLEKVRASYPVSLHGVGLSLGATDDLNWRHAKKLRDLMMRIDPCLVSDHLSWSSFNGQYFHDLLPLPYTAETITHVVARIQQMQDYLQRPLLIENISSYINFSASSMNEAEFIGEIAKQSGCGILLDINNIYVTAMNQQQNPRDFIANLNTQAIQEIHLAGFTTVTLQQQEILIDSHNRAIVPAVWDLFQLAIRKFGPKPTIIEWDSELPLLETLCLEAYRAEQAIREIYAASKLTG
jgi:uncharacterized protein